MMYLALCIDNIISFRPNRKGFVERIAHGVNDARHIKIVLGYKTASRLQTILSGLVLSNVHNRPKRPFIASVSLTNVYGKEIHPPSVLHMQRLLVGNVEERKKMKSREC